MTRSPGRRPPRLALAALAASAACAALAAAPSSAPAQTRPQRLQLEGRVDALFSRGWAAQLGGGASVPLGTYVRAGAVVGAGYASGDALGSRSLGVRVDAVARFLLDPLMQFRRAPYAGGGVTYRSDVSSRHGLFLLLVLGYEGAPVRGVLPAVELGLGGGARVGVVLRRAVPGRR